MKTRLLSISFLIVVFALAAVNAGNCLLSLQPLVNQYVKHEQVENVSSAHELIGKVEDTYNNAFVTKMAFVELHGATRKALSSNWYNAVLRLKNGYLTYRYYDGDVKPYADEVTKLCDYVQSRGAKFLYVSVPYKVSPLDGNKEIPKGFNEKGNVNQNNMLKYLSKEGVPFYDLRKPMAVDYPDWYSAFFRTDQHWKPETGFWAYGKMAKFFKQRYAYDYDPMTTNLDYYHVDKYKNWFLGSQGRKTGLVYSGGAEDFSLIYPLFKTKMEVDVPVHNEHRKGTFREVMFKDSNLVKDYYNVNTYATYIGGDYPLCIQKNPDASNKKKILVLKDSFTIAMQPYLSFMFNEVDVIDLRHYHKSLKKYIDKTDPDIVMVLYTSSMMSYPRAFDFGL